MTLALLQIDFVFDGPWGDALADVCRELADDIAQEPGLRWKLWTEDPESARAGGVYLFDDRAAAAAYLTKHRARLAAFGVKDSDIVARVLDVNPALSTRTRGPVGGAADSFTTLARVQVADTKTFLDVFASAGLAARSAHGSKGAQVFAGDENTVHVLIDWADEAAFDAFRTAPDVAATMKRGGAVARPVFQSVRRLGQFTA
ncbi:monooxygenase [Schlegelella sp. ID0723]|uniref:Monooxygenase n=2 Tax=Piscinibacter koreensis TaxID=2742824 RepID=A0A7Y6TY91_9BURK|nr:monooxygenase [Schlegelella koreensis]